jgi:hypothetical protein
MTNAYISGKLAEERRRELEDAAHRYRLAHQSTARRRVPLRAGAGRVLVRAGLRLARVDRPYPTSVTRLLTGL